MRGAKDRAGAGCCPTLMRLELCSGENTRDARSQPQLCSAAARGTAEAVSSEAVRTADSPGRQRKLQASSLSTPLGNCFPEKSRCSGTQISYLKRLIIKHTYKCVHIYSIYGQHKIDELFLEINLIKYAILQKSVNEIPAL